MGYNGSNRKGTRRSMFSESNFKSGNKLISGLFASIILAPFLLTNISANSTNHNNSSNINNQINNNSINRCNLIISPFFVIIMITLGFYLIQFQSGFAFFNLLGIFCLILSVIFCIIFIMEIKTFRLNKRISDNYYKSATIISNKIRNKLSSDYSFELLFYFTQPLIDFFSYNMRCSNRFKKTFSEYSIYVKQWNSIYWNYSFQMKLHDMLKSEIKNQLTLDISSEPLFYESLEKKISQFVNSNEKDYFNKVKSINNNNLSVFLSFETYKQIIETKDNSQIELLLFKDLKQRIKDISLCLYKRYGGKWESKYIKIFV